MKYTAYISLLGYGATEVMAENEQEAKEKVYDTYNAGNILWDNEEITDITLVPAVECSRTYQVTEMCPHCESEVSMSWNTDTMGFEAFCPVCGKRLMLCDECVHAEDSKSCDYNRQTDSCYRRRK